MADDSVMETVRELIAQTLALEVEEVTPPSKFFDDLGGESIDVLDLQFKCEKHWGVKVQFGGIMGPGQIKTDEQGRLTAESVAALCERFPSFRAGGIREGMKVDDLRGLLTVQTISDYMTFLLSEQKRAVDA